MPHDGSFPICWPLAVVGPCDTQRCAAPEGQTVIAAIAAVTFAEIRDSLFQSFHDILMNDLEWVDVNNRIKAR